MPCLPFFFEAALRGRFRGATEQRVELPEDDNDTFALFVEFVSKET